MFYVNTYKGRHDPKRKDNLYVKTNCAVSEIYFSTSITLLPKALLNIFICETHIAPNKSPGVYIVDITYAVL
jgi:hypothetical protein